MKRLAALAPLLALAAACGGSDDVHGTTKITSRAHLPAGGGPITGTFRATGAVDDSGTLLDTFKVLPKSPAGDDRARVERNLHGKKGTIRIRFVLTVTKSGRATGLAHTLFASGDYAPLRGPAGVYNGHIDFLPHGAENIRDTITIPVDTGEREASTA